MTQSATENPSREASSQVVEPASLDAMKILRMLAPKILNLVNVTALLTVGGFFVIHSYIASFSKLFTFNISVTQYVAAGINLVLAIVAYIAYLLLPGLGYGVLTILAIGVLYLIGRVSVSRSKRMQNLWEKLRQWWLPLYGRIRPWLRRIWAVYQFVAGTLLISAAILSGLVYGTYHYAQSPRMLGGGMPAEVILVFREEQPTQYSIWGFPINVSNPRQSERVQLLIELTDGIIVKDSATNRITTVKNDVIQGIIDVDTLQNPQTNATAIPNQPSTTATP